MPLFKSKSRQGGEAVDPAHLDPNVNADAKGWNSDSDNPPAYDDDAPAYDDVANHGAASTSASSAGGSLIPTAQLQIQAVGYSYNAALCGSTFEQISVYRPDSGALEYTSVRLEKKSNSCGLVRSPHAASPSSVPLIATVYRWGPGRVPRIRILPRDATANVDEAINSESVPGAEVVEVKNRSMFSRAQILETSFGKFEWRYGSREERKATYGANSLIVLDRLETGLLKSGKRTRVAQLVRNDEFRTPGTTRNMGGNGGRLMMNLSDWADGKTVSAQDMEAFIVAGCICMLKREADRFRDNAIAAVV